MQRPQGEIRQIESKKNKILIDFLGTEGGVNIAENLKHKWDKNTNNYTQIISLEDFNDHLVKMEFSPKLNGATQIYILAHGVPGTEYIEARNAKKIYVINLAKNLAHFIGENKVVINLLSCGGGRGKNTIEDDTGVKSFAAKLHQFLSLQTKKNIPVVARIHSVRVRDSIGEWWEMGKSNSTGIKKTIDLDLTWNDAQRCTGEKEAYSYIAKQPGSKVIYTSDSEGEQIRIDAYTHKWKTKAIKQIEELAKNTQVPKIKELLLAWLENFNHLTAKQVFDVLCNEVMKDTSILKQHPSDEFFLVALFTTPTLFTKIQNLIDEGKPYFSSKHTINDPTITGRSIKNK